MKSLDEANRRLEAAGVEIRPGGQDSPPNWFDVHSKATGELVAVFATVEAAIDYYASDGRTGSERGT